MGGFRDKLNRMMYGRYGNDQLNKAILILTIICLVISMFTRIQAFYMIALAGFCWHIIGCCRGTFQSGAWKTPAI